jgi:hypothetical protein
MNLCSEVVKHKKFGVGTIVESNSDYIIVRFHETNEQKKFFYPDAIGEFLEIQNKPSPDNKEHFMKETEHEREHEQRRIKGIKGRIKREKDIKKIIGIRREEERNK